MKLEENLEVYMIREHLDDIPQYRLPPPYTLRSYRPGDGLAWRRIHIEADKYSTFPPGRFEQEFGLDEALLAERQFYLCDGQGKPVGTATAWFGTHNGILQGRVHWVAIVPAEQGRGLSKPLLSAVCSRLSRLHKQAYLDTGTARLAAINLYLKFGFVPDIKNEEHARRWTAIRQALGHTTRS